MSKKTTLGSVPSSNGFSRMSGFALGAQVDHLQSPRPRERLEPPPLRQHRPLLAVEDRHHDLRSEQSQPQNTRDVGRCGCLST